MASKTQRAAQARAEAKAKALAQAKARERRTTAIIVAASIGVLAILAGVVFFIVQSSKNPTLADVEWPAGGDETGGILVGEATEGATRVDVYLDFMCPYCGVFEELNARTLTERSEAGEVNLYYHPLSFLDRYSNGTKFSTRSANAAAVVADQSPEHFGAFFEAMFSNQPAEGTSGLTDEEIAQIAVAVGVPQAVADTFKDGAFIDWVRAATDQSSIDGISGTPSIMVNREVVPQQTVPYMQEGVLGQFLDSLKTS